MRRDGGGGGKRNNLNHTNLNDHRVGTEWHRSVNLATQESKISGLKVQGLPGL